MSKLGSLKIVELKEEPDAGQKAEKKGHKIARAAFQVHSVLGPGFTPSVYKEALAIELRNNGADIQADIPFAIRYRDQDITAFTADLLVDNETIVFVRTEPKSEEQKTFLATCLKHVGQEEAFLINFQVSDMRQGIMRAAVQKASIQLQATRKGSLN